MSRRAYSSRQWCAPGTAIYDQNVLVLQHANITTRRATQPALPGHALAGVGHAPSPWPAYEEGPVDLFMRNPMRGKKLTLPLVTFFPPMRRRPPRLNLKTPDLAPDGRTGAAAIRRGADLLGGFPRE
eukprot:1186967-Prorocentrum_minimum.AAC.4